MSVNFKKLLFTITFNSSLFLFLIIGIQNSTKRNRVNFLIDETVNLPVSFIMGISFISGSLIGSLITIKSQEEKQ